MHQNKHFRYYEFGPKRLDPLICLGGAASTADCFYKQVLALSSKVGAAAAADKAQGFQGLYQHRLPKVSGCKLEKGSDLKASERWCLDRLIAYQGPVKVQCMSVCQELYSDCLTILLGTA